jgi:hypothetical protein
MNRYGAHFGRILGSPPGLPGGGIIGVLPMSGAGARIPRSTSAGGHSTPSDLASLSLIGSFTRPTVESSSPLGPSGPIGSQPTGDCEGGGAIRSGGVVGVGGACAAAMLDITTNPQIDNSERFVYMRQSTPPLSVGSKKYWFRISSETLSFRLPVQDLVRRALRLHTFAAFDP